MTISVKHDVAGDGDITGWVDIDFPIIIRTTGTAIPTLTKLSGNITAPQWEVNDVNICESQEFVHGWKEGTDFMWHVHMITNGLEAVDKYVKWEVEWVHVNVNGAVGNTTVTTSAEFAIPANTPTKTHLIVPIATISLPTGTIGSHTFASLKRVAATGTAPAANPWCSMLQMHIECDTVGSRSVQRK